jgi:hypothetical protein
VILFAMMSLEGRLDLASLEAGAGLATIWIRIHLLRRTKREAMTGFGDEAIQSSSETVVPVWIPSIR